MLGEGSYGKVFLGHSIDPAVVSKIKLPEIKVRNAYSNIDEQINDNSEISLLNMDQPTCQPSHNVTSNTGSNQCLSNPILDKQV